VTVHSHQETEMLLQNETDAYIIILYKTVKFALGIYLFTFILKIRKYTEENNEISIFIPHRIFTDFNPNLFEKKKKTQAPFFTCHNEKCYNPKKNTISVNHMGKENEIMIALMLEMFQPLKTLLHL